jgi:hypothetical protein
MINHWDLGVTIARGRYSPNTKTQFSEMDYDTEENWKKNPNLEWSADSFTYKFNSHGYRSREFKTNDERPLMIGLGCSHTMGVGIPFKDTWVEQLGKQLSWSRVYNLGQGGCSNDAIARLATNVIPIMRPEVVSILWTNYERFETYENNKLVQHGPWSEKKLVSQMQEDNAYNNYTRNKLIVELLQREYKFKLVEFYIEDMHKKHRDLPLARDNMHNGSQWHKAVAEEFNTLL